ncbi:OLC1v1006253C1 [Oldenlandia corymbosa var. corymbosa]|uniref:OLC1v1006253C1 n=1 Tax=Oldenlandia corymbosa var. corymbosa TaxID=529605 RepID=A0AAV1DJW5_OLDCO|nr:OLC1v1006253C1 [Oldenlandia corymbosa var. corymbosa]
MADTRKKRKISPTRKLLVNDRVEVRSVEEGFLGSWHAGVVIECGKQSRHVQYDEILDDDGSQGMVEVVNVSPILEGLIPGDCSTSAHCRGNIRPSPPLIEFQSWSLHFGQCVDVYYQDAWWEGVIFDHQDGCDERRVFFPDMGDDLKATKDILRMTQDWDEVTEEWKIRGNWSLLELLEEVELNWPLLISVRQIWYEIQIQVGFEKLKDWTSSSKEIWKELLGQVLSACYNLTLKQMLEEISSTGDFAEENQLPESTRPAFEAILKPEEFFCNSQVGVPFQSGFGMDCHATLPEDSINTNSSSPEEENTPLCLASTTADIFLDRSNLNSIPSPHVLQSMYNPMPVTSLPKFDDNSHVGSATNIEIHHSIRKPKGKYDSSFKKLKKYVYSSNERSRLQWLPAESYLNLEAENCPDSVAQCISSKRSSQNTDARKHLLFLGWKVQCARDKTMTRMRYISPKNEMFYSLYQACLALQFENQSPTSRENKSCKVDQTAGMISPQLTEESKKQIGNSKISCGKDIVNVEKEHGSQAVLEYSQLRRMKPTGRLDKLKDLASKVKKHLSVVGWKIYNVDKKGKKELRYTSPSGKTFYSLLTACQWYLTEVGYSVTCAPYGEQFRENHTLQSTGTHSSSSGHMECKILFGDLPKKRPAELLCYQHVGKGEMEVHGSSKEPKTRKLGLRQKSTAPVRPGLQNEGPSLFDSPGSTKKGKDLKAVFSASVLQQSMATLTSAPQNEHSYFLDSPGSIEDGKDVRAVLPVSVFRKKAREVVISSSTYQVPRTVLSLLIDSNIVVPGAIAHYKNRKDGSRMKEGTVSREGIQCTCCQEVFTLSKFEAHAGSTLHRPSANIFLEDGRSLVDCQIQLKGENSVKKRGYRPNQVQANRYTQENDSICSICHYGGELLLCDHCPSSFHTNCLGLKEIPHGDWFCTSCCCAICGLGRFDEDNKQHKDDNFLNCSQCERPYHFGCLRRKDLVKPDYQQEGTWFCNARCEQIHLGLQNLLGKPIPVGEDNLSWTLLKYKKAEVSADNECVESYSKLNVALSIMHECFEPVKEPRSGRDLVKDVIFSREIQRHQLNFKGFYTVALERNDELISVATVRVHGEKVAEIPLVATRYKYRRQGMCRFLMNELEKKLMEFGVERLVLPAVSSVLTTWETSFGFSRMNDAERLSFLDCCLLDFPGTVFCQKLLKDTPNPNVLKALREDPVEQSEILDQGTTEYAPSPFLQNIYASYNPNSLS